MIMEAILQVECQEPEGEIIRSVRLMPLSVENMRFLWEKLSQFPILFNRHIQGIDDFINTFISQNPDGSLRPNGIVWEVDDIGIFFLTDIYPAYQATGHFTFWDRRFRGRRDLIRAMIAHTFKEFGFHRIIAEVPLYAMPTIHAMEGIGLIKEGRMRKAAWYNGEWWDCNVYSILEEEVGSWGS
jgi:RimJ/RimL family protein N-acetyltransferase